MTSAVAAADTRVRVLGRAVQYKWVVATVAVSSLFLDVLDVTIVNGALPALGQELQSDAVEWVVLGYTLALAVSIPVAGWWSDRIGSKRAFLVSLFLFVTLDNLPFLGQVNSNGLFASGFTVMVLLTAASVLRQPGSATLMGLLITLLRLLITYLVPAATELQADLAGLQGQLVLGLEHRRGRDALQHLAQGVVRGGCPVLNDDDGGGQPGGQPGQQPPGDRQSAQRGADDNDVHASLRKSFSRPSSAW